MTKEDEIERLLDQEPSHPSEEEGIREEGVPKSEMRSDSLKYAENYLLDHLGDAEPSNTFRHDTVGEIIATEREDTINVKYHLNEEMAEQNDEGEFYTPLLMNSPDEVIERAVSGILDYTEFLIDSKERSLRASFTYSKDNIGIGTEEVAEAIESIDPAY